MVGECLQCVKEPSKEVDKNAVAVIRTNSHCKEEVVGHWQQIFMIMSLFVSLPHCTFDIFANGKGINHGGEYELEIPANFNFYVLEKANKLAKN